MRFFSFLNWVTQYRETHPWIIYGLPLAGFTIALSYKYWGNPSSKGNNLLIEEYLHPQRRIPLIMAPLVLFGTLLTHLFGGSAGREGTAVQIGGAVSDQLNRWFDFDKTERRILISIGITAGFAAVFGTPLAGTIFGLEVLLIGKKDISASCPVYLPPILRTSAVNYGIFHTPIIQFMMLFQCCP